MTDLTREQMQERIDRLTDCLNQAVTELSLAGLSENFDADDCLDCIERIKDELKPMGKTSDWHTLWACYDRLCAACGVDNGAEIDILPIVEKRLRSAVPEGCVVVPRTHIQELLEYWNGSYNERAMNDALGHLTEGLAAMLSAAPPAAAGWVSVKDNHVPEPDGALVWVTGVGSKGRFYGDAKIVSGQPFLFDAQADIHCHETRIDYYQRIVPPGEKG